MTVCSLVDMYRRFVGTCCPVASFLLTKQEAGPRVEIVYTG
jgi:hypothetical protein